MDSAKAVSLNWKESDGWQMLCPVNRLTAMQLLISFCYAISYHVYKYELL